MAERILGPAYPALLAPGLRVVHSAAGVGTMVAAIPPSVVFDAAPGAVLVCDGPPDLRIDYADPHTRDRVARALEARLCATHDRDRPTDLRDLAERLWGAPPRWVAAGRGAEGDRHAATPRGGAMDEATRALAAEVVTLRRWRWMPGMLYWLGERDAGDWGRVEDAWADDWAPPEGAWPDLDDAATLGCLLALVREAWREPGLVARFLPNWVDRDAMSVWRVTIPVKPPSAGCSLWRNVARGPTEAHALVAALGAAPGHDSGHDPSKVAP